MSTQDKIRLAALAAELHTYNARIESGRTLRSFPAPSFRAAVTRQDIRQPNAGRYSLVTPSSAKGSK